MRIMHKSPCFGLIVGTRGFFNAELAVDVRARLLGIMDEMGFEYVITPEAATPCGAIETREHAKLCAALFKENAERIDGVIVVLPNFGDELGIVQTLELARLDVPVLVQACDDEVDKLSISERRDAFCGKLSVCNNLYQYGIPFTNTTYHTYPIDSVEFRRDLDFFMRVCRVVKGLRNARIGQIGARPAAFQTVRYSEKLLQAAGITIVPVDLSEIIFGAQSLQDDDPDVQAKLAEVKSYGAIPAGIAEANMLKQAKLSVTIDRWMDQNECDASAIECWDSIQKNYGCATCLSMAMMGDRLLPSACEVDVAGAVSMYALLLASGNPPSFQDWNNNYGDDRDMCINTHCSNFPKTFVAREVEVGNLDILGASLGPDRCFGAIKGQATAGPMTFFRVSTDDPNGEIKAYLGQGEMTDDPVGNFQGGSAVCRVEGLQLLLDYLCKNGFEHHVAVTRDHVARVLEEAIETYLGWDLYRHS
ncbi:MAG: L-fucose/L-arabinose isomerase family protein [Anaerolineae bacterium]|nr:L-fucose/L-arabinose isomerase family protein [Anaerolineae bacterium]